MAKLHAAVWEAKLREMGVMTGISLAAVVLGFLISAPKLAPFVPRDLLWLAGGLFLLKLRPRW